MYFNYLSKHLLNHILKHLILFVIKVGIFFKLIQLICDVF